MLENMIADTQDFALKYTFVNFAVYSFILAKTDQILGPYFDLKDKVSYANDVFSKTFGNPIYQTVALSATYAFNSANI